MLEDREITEDVSWEYCLEDERGGRVYVEDTATAPQIRLDEFEDRYAVRYRPGRLRSGPIGRPDDIEVSTTKSHDAAIEAAERYIQEL